MRINWVMARSNLAGGTKSNRLIAEAMVRRGHDVTITYLRPGRPLPSLLKPRKFFRQLIRNRDARRHHHLLESTVRLRQIDADRITHRDVPDADVSIGTWWKTMEWIRDWPTEKGRPAYFIRHHELHGGDAERVRATYRQEALKLVIARWLQRVMDEEYGDPSAVLVPNGVDRSQFDSEPRGKQAVPTVGVLVGVQDWKGTPAAFRALARVQEARPGTRVVAFGRKALNPGLVLPGDFEYHQHPAQQLIPELYRGADCWLVPSRIEGFGMPGLEAAACRCPLVSTRSGGPEDYTREGENGYLVDVDDDSAMADRIMRVLDMDESEWCGLSEASYRISREFDWDRSAETLERALTEYVESSGT